MIQFLKELGTFIKKWFWCSIFHYNHRCYNEVWDAKSKYWHCTKCHPCNELFDKLNDGAVRTTG